MADANIGAILATPAGAKNQIAINISCSILDYYHNLLPLVWQNNTYTSIITLNAYVALRYF